LNLQSHYDLEIQEIQLGDRLHEEVDEIFYRMDRLVARCGLEKTRAIGEDSMVAATEGRMLRKYCWFPSGGPPLPRWRDSL
jgi:hypothetical protein